MVNIFKFLEKTKGKPIPFIIKLLYNIPLTEDELIYNGGLNLYKSNITYLPDNLTINGWLNLFQSKIKSLPNNLRVDGWLDITETSISELPDDLYVSGDLYYHNTPLLHKIKNDKSLLELYSKQVKGNLW